VTETSAGAGAPARISAIRWPLLLVLASLAALAPVATDLYLPGFPELGADFGVEASAVSGFGQDNAKELYVLSLTDGVFRIDPA